MDRKFDELDRSIIELISKRFEMFANDLKKNGVDAVEAFSPAERARLLALIESANRGPIPNEIIRRLYTELLTSAVNSALPVKVAYLGPAGTFSHSALLEIFGETAQSAPMKSIHDVFVEVESGRARFGVVPIENSTEGAVTYTYDELLEADVKIVGEKYLRITYSIVSVETDIKKVRKLYSHPQSFAQCKEWIRKNLPGVELHNVASTSLAAEAASWDKFSAAISSETSATIYKLNVLESGIEDSRQNYTRFFVIGGSDTLPTEKDKTSIVCAVRDRPGALYNLLRPFHDAGINMTKIESRPDKKKMWEYNFFIDFIGHKDTTVVRQAMEKMKEELIFLKILGSYPAEK